MKTPDVFRRALRLAAWFLTGIALPAQPAAAGTAADSTIFGLGIQLRVDIGIRRTSNYTLSLNAGVGRYVGNHALVVYQFNANLYRGGLGNSLLYSDQNNHQFDLVNAFSLTIGQGSYAFPRPVYTWTPNYAQSIINTYRHSLTLSTNFLWNNHRRSQQIGALCLSSGDVMLGYYNDGLPFNLIGLSDGFDRYWTGGGFLHVIVQPTRYQTIMRFDKFTGFVRDAFELANALRLRYALYSDLNQMAFNQGRLSLTVIHPSRAAFSASLYNRFDVQDLIHRSMRIAYHPNIYRWRFMLGGQYWNYLNTKLLIE
ncbi:MAG: hypothetical protein IPM81_06330 [Saprospirales bacterium]|nr:hypothetical protein [Saprospirales bacterium]